MEPSGPLGLEPDEAIEPSGALDARARWGRDANSGAVTPSKILSSGHTCPRSSLSHVDCLQA